MAEVRLRETVNVRPARAADARAIAVIDARETKIAKVLHWRRLLEDEGRCALVAERGGKVVGFLLGETRAWEFGSPPTGWIYAVGVDAATRRDGIGRMLVETAIARFRASGAKSVRTMVKRDDVLLQRFFRSAGFAQGPFVELEIGP